MKSLRELYKIGKGPSSSHTMGPQKAAQIFAAQNEGAISFSVTLYGSLAATGKGHMTDVAIEEVLSPLAPTTIVWEPTKFLPFHPNGMTFNAIHANGRPNTSWTVYSVGGGTLSEGDHPTGVLPPSPDIYPLSHLSDIKKWCYGHKNEASNGVNVGWS